MAPGAPSDEYAREAGDFAGLITARETITDTVVAGVWHKWFGEGDEPGGPTAAWEHVADLAGLSGRFVGAEAT